MCCASTPSASAMSSPRPSRHLLANPLADQAGRDEALSVCAGESGGQGRGRTADLPLFRRTLIPTELPDLALARGRWARAVLTGFEPATSTLTGWRALQAALQDLMYCSPPRASRVPPTGFEPVPPP